MRYKLRKYSAVTPRVKPTGYDATSVSLHFLLQSLLAAPDKEEQKEAA
jgi:hypothetical protein